MATTLWHDIKFYSSNACVPWLLGCIFVYLQSSCSHNFIRVENHDMLETHPCCFEITIAVNTKLHFAFSRGFRRMVHGCGIFPIVLQASHLPKEKTLRFLSHKTKSNSKTNMILTQDLFQELDIFGASKCLSPVFPISIHWPSIRSTVASQLLVAKGSSEASHSVAVLTLKP